jgi:hypothetical protein
MPPVAALVLHLALLAPVAHSPADDLNRSVAAPALADSVDRNVELTDHPSPTYEALSPRSGDADHERAAAEASLINPLTPATTLSGVTHGSPSPIAPATVASGIDHPWFQITPATASLMLECPDCGMLLAQALTEGEQRRKDLAAHIDELTLKLGQLDSGWPNSSAAMAGIGVGLAAVGLITGATLAGYGYVNSLIVAGFVLMGVGVVGVGLVIAALVIAAPRVAAAQRERGRLTEEKMRAEAELQFLRGMATGPRP